MNDFNSRYSKVVLILGFLLIGGSIVFSFLSIAVSQSSYIPQNLASINCSSNSVYLPIIDSDYYGGSMEIEGNNESTQSTGPLISGKTYTGTLDVDEKDYFKFEVHQPGDIEIYLVDPNDPSGTDFYNEGVHLVLFYANGDFRTVTPSDMVAHQPTPIYSIITNTVDLGTSNGWYFVYIYAPSNLAQQSPYQLRVNFPNQVVVTPPTPLPTCTPTATPTPKATPTPPKPLPFHCDQIPQFPPDLEEGSYIIVFDGTKLKSGMETIPIEIEIPSGEYRIRLASFDDLHGVGASTQDDEKWKLILYDDNETVIIESEETSDLLDDDLCNEQIFENILIVSRAVESVTGRHKIEIPTPAEPNSIAPLYAILEPVNREKNSEIKLEAPIAED